jgi:hypothetical protein
MLYMVGPGLDKLKTIGLSATLQGMQVNSYVDVTAGRVRLEVRQNGQLIQVEQLEGQSGWMWQKGQVMPLPANRMSEMSTIFYSGLLGLRKADIEALTIKNTKITNSVIAITGEREGKQLVFLLNRQSQLIGSADKAGKQASTSIYSDFRNTGGILVPFQEANTVGQQKSLIKYEKVEINPGYTEATWSKP